ncbi:putative spermidine synthase [Apostichopus japonicus]|uniref:Putative spermidine synthase n=1 Tax=Stichopus japonicus TaxID=307972 RepID=A0A2G8JM21_STIJA|nr:putative spermidine synthase [Apostichopus japonicus]
MSHVSMNSHPAPRKVLIVGGGDGGVAREVLKHPEVEEVILCEIDEKVVEVCKKYFPSLTSSAFTNPKLKIIFADGLEFIRENTNKFDVIITDSSDNVGVATPLFGEEYYKLMKSALATGGVACSQGECFWLHSEFIAKMVTLCRDIFSVVDFAVCSMPTYPSGEQGFLLCSLDPLYEPRKLIRYCYQEAGT